MSFCLVGARYIACIVSHIHTILAVIMGFGCLFATLFRVVLALLGGFIRDLYTIPSLIYKSFLAM